MLYTLLLAIVLVSVGSVHSENTCHACNCNFHNIEFLTGLVERIVNKTVPSVVNNTLDCQLACIFFLYPFA